GAGRLRGLGGVRLLLDLLFRRGHLDRGYRRGGGEISPLGTQMGVLRLGPASQLLASLGAVGGGGVVLGSLLGAAVVLLHRAGRTEILEGAGVGGIFGAGLAMGTLAIERISGL
ncbi:MAG: hypothetical protein ACXWEK_06310, partial [Solirubrobacterales bacterium]